MTRAVRDRILKEANGDISDHLRNHIHLTNCIHLKNHMHKHSPIMADRSIMRDLVVLQRSRSLRDPSASPSSWHSPSVVDLLTKKGENDVMIREGRRSVGIDRRRESRRLSGCSPTLDVFASSKVAPGEVSGVKDRASAMSERSSNKSGIRGGRRIRRGETDRKSNRSDFLVGNEETTQDQDADDLAHDTIVRNSESRDRNTKQKGKHVKDVQMKTLSEQLKDVPMDSDDVASSNIHLQGRRSRVEKTGGEPDVSVRGHCSGLHAVKRRKFRGARRTRAVIASRDNGCQNEMSVASNSLVHASAHPKYHIEEGEEEYAEQNFARAPRSGCGIPWNWSRIHHRGKSFLDIAGRSLSCGLSESRLRREGAAPTGRDASDMPVASDYSSSPGKYNTEAVPLLVDASGSQESTENAAWVHDYSGELGIFADNLMKRDVDSDLASEARSGDQKKFKRYPRSRHQNLTQKYMPRSFRDMVGQNLVAQALSNAVIKRKVGLLYVFYGPHGTGKTSCARIFSRGLNCQSLEHPKPCGICNSCIAQDMGKSRNIREVGPVSNFDFESIMNLLENKSVSQLQSQYRVFIFDDCDSLSPECWSAITKFIDRAPRRVVFVLVCSSLDVLPHIIISRCQKFFFPKLKDADIIYTLQWIATKEDLEIDVDALKLIASRSDGSLRDAEMTLEQLSLLGQRITVPLVQELVGLISDEKLVDLLDLALSADTVNTVKNLRVVMETGVEPLALMSQLATVITDILAGSYDFSKDRLRRKFFRRQPLSKEDMEKLRLALKTLSEAEKQLRMSNDKLTWLTAALLQLAPDQQYLLPSSSADTSFNHSPLPLNNARGRDIDPNGRGLPTNGRIENHRAGSSGDLYENSVIKGSIIDRKRHTASGMAPQHTSGLSADTVRVGSRQIPNKNWNGIDEIWLEFLEKIQINSLKEFLYQEGKLISVNCGAASTVGLMFSSHVAKSKAEKFSGHILEAFESVLGSQVTIEIRCESKKDPRGVHMPLILPTSMDSCDPTNTDHRKHRAVYDDVCQSVPRERDVNAIGTESLGMGRSEIVEIGSSPRHPKSTQHVDNSAESNKRSLGTAWVGEVTGSHKNSTMVSIPERRKFGEQSQSRSLVRGKVSLAHVIQQAEGCAQQSGWSKRKAVSIAEKLEQENLRLEPKSRSLLCWKASRSTRGKLSRVKIRTRRPHSLLKLVSCGKCLLSKSPS